MRTVRAAVYNALGQAVDATLAGGAEFDTFYDAQGRNVGAFHTNPSSTWPNYWLGERFLGFYNTGANASEFIHSEQLGSCTVTTDQTGNVTQDALFYPWGQQWTAFPTCGWFASMGNGLVGLVYETLFRRYSGAQGRWLSPDPLAGDVSNPQSLNRYAYVKNNPTTLTDPSGACTPGQANCPPPHAQQCLTSSCAHQYYRWGPYPGFANSEGSYECLIDGVEGTCGTGLCPSWGYSATTNRITNSGVTYDAAGNLTADATGTGSHTYNPQERRGGRLQVRPAAS